MSPEDRQYLIDEFTKILDVCVAAGGSASLQHNREVDSVMWSLAGSEDDQVVLRYTTTINMLWSEYVGRDHPDFDIWFRKLVRR